MLNKGNTLSAVEVVGRPTHPGMLYWFQRLCQWLESEGDAELYTLKELHAKMSAFSDGAEVYTPKRLKQKLHEQYNNFICFAEIEGRSNVLCFRNMANFIVNKRWQSESIEDSADEAECIVIAAADIQLRVAHVVQETFLSNKGNKNQFILLLSHYLVSDGRTVHTSTGDADTMIVSCALEIANNGMEVNVVADDTDVLILLMYHWRKTMSDVYFLSEPKRAQKKGLKVWSISDLITKAGGLVTSHFLYIHAWSGCDTTSATFGHGKTTDKDPCFRRSAANTTNLLGLPTITALHLVDKLCYMELKSYENIMNVYSKVLVLLRKNV